MSVATFHTLGDCKYSRPGDHSSGLPENLQPEPRWVCFRTTVRRGVTEEDCAECPYWQHCAEPNGASQLYTERDR